VDVRARALILLFGNNYVILETVVFRKIVFKMTVKKVK